MPCRCQRKPPAGPPLCTPAVLWDRSMWVQELWQNSEWGDLQQGQRPAVPIWKGVYRGSGEWDGEVHWWVEAVWHCQTLFYSNSNEVQCVELYMCFSSTMGTCIAQGLFVYLFIYWLISDSFFSYIKVTLNCLGFFILFIMPLFIFAMIIMPFMYRMNCFTLKICENKLLKPSKNIII